MQRPSISPSLARLRSSLWLALGLATLLAAALPSACSSDADPRPEPEPPVVVVTPPEPGAPWESLSEWNLYADLRAQEPAERVLPFEVIAPLFSDYTKKRRFVHLPEGATIAYASEGPLGFPVGTILVKTFSYPADLREPEGEERILETRILHLEPNGWAAHTYVWNDEQTEAVRLVAGKFIDASFVDASGQAVQNLYRVPNTNECKDCHQNQDSFVSLGGRSRQLDRAYDYGEGPVNQLEHLAALGWLEGLPPASERTKLVDPFGSDELSLRVRSYFDANCSACHTTGGNASQSSLLLDFAATDPESQPSSNWGVCKIPTSAGGATCGHTYDVVPGDPDRSIMICRMASTDLEVRMPPLGIRLVHAEGLALVRQWIASMPPEGSCQ